MVEIPIDYRQTPVRQKYLEELPLFQPWYIFGVYPNGMVDVCDSAGDVFTHVPFYVARQLIRARDEFLAAVFDKLTRKSDQLES